MSFFISHSASLVTGSRGLGSPGSALGGALSNRDCCGPGIHSQCYLGPDAEEEGGANHHILRDLFGASLLPILRELTGSMSMNWPYDPKRQLFLHFEGIGTGDPARILLDIFSLPEICPLFANPVWLQQRDEPNGRTRVPYFICVTVIGPALLRDVVGAVSH